VLGEHYEYKKERASKMPKKRGFYVEHNPFRFEWDEEIEKNG
jgi:hypothetical protein